MRTAFVGLLAVALFACSTAVADENVGAETIVLIATSEVRAGEPTTYTFRQAIVSERRFTREHVGLTFNAMGFAGAGAELRKPDALETAIRIGARSAPAGDYALLYHRRAMAHEVIETCYAEGAPIYRFQPDAINIVAIGDVRAVDGDELLALVEQVLAEHPNLTAPRVFPEVVGVATFETGQWLGRRNCVARGGAFNFVPTAPPAP